MEGHPTCKNNQFPTVFLWGLAKPGVTPENQAG